MGVAVDVGEGPAESVRIVNRSGRGRVVVVCEHASNTMPAGYGTLGLEPHHLDRHIAWDPGALPVARVLASLLDAPLVESGVSRLVVDCNRPVDAPDLIPVTGEDTPIPGNARVDEVERQRRIGSWHRPFHNELDALIADRTARGRETWLITVHTFTPVFKGTARPWHVGVIHDSDDRLATPLIDGLRKDPSLVVGVNEPYSPADRVYYTHERHARPRGLPCAMIEIRNDMVTDASSQRHWGESLARLLTTVELASDREDTVA